MDVAWMGTAGYGLLFVGMALFVYQFFPSREEIEGKRRAELGVVREWSEDVSLLKWFYPLVRLLLPMVRRLSLPGTRRRLQRWITTAGLEGELTVDDLFALELIISVLFLLMAAKFFDGVVAVVIGYLVGFGFPLFWLNDRKKARQKEILHQIPNVVDMLALTVDAGMDFNSAIKRVCDQLKGEGNPLVDELQILLQNIRLGMSREDALRVMAERIDVQAVYAFSSILVQSEKMGSSIVQVLKDQSAKLRTERFLKAEREGVVASQKLMIPMVVFIFPLIFFVVLGPYILKFIYR